MRDLSKSLNYDNPLHTNIVLINSFALCNRPTSNARIFSAFDSNYGFNTDYTKVDTIDNTATTTTTNVAAIIVAFDETVSNSV
jgi:hypothetical protein